MPIHKLTPRKAKTAGPEKYEDGGGLRLVVSKSGARKWVLRYTINGKQREIGLGNLLSFSLSDARTRAASFRGMASEGTGPITVPEQIPNFTTCAARYIRAH